MIKTSKKFDVVSVKQEMISDFSGFFQPFFKKVVTNNKKEKFAISTYRLFKYSKEHMHVVRCSVNSSGTVFSDFNIQKPGAIPANSVPKRLYNAPLKIKDAKVKDVQSLVEKYVPLADKWFYQQLATDETVDNDTDSGSDKE